MSTGAANATSGTGTAGAAGTGSGQAGGVSSGQGAASGAGGASPPGGSGSGATVTSISDWTSGMNDGHKSYVQQKGFKDPVAVLDSYINMEKLIGVPQERLLKLPSKEDDPGWGEVYEKLGRPKDAKEYKIDVPKEMGDDKFADWARNTFHELGISKSAGEKLASKWTEYAQNGQKAKAEAYVEQVNKDDGVLKKEWGVAYDKHVAMAKNAAGAFGIDGPTIDKLEATLGFAGTMRFFQNIGAKLGEGNFISGGSGGGTNFGNVMAPDAARGRIESLRKDSDFVRRYTSGEIAAREEMDRLHKMAYPDQ